MKTTDKQAPKRVSDKDWEDSRQGRLGRFPPPNLYEPEEEPVEKGTKTGRVIKPA